MDKSHIELQCQLPKKV